MSTSIEFDWSIDFQQGKGLEKTITVADLDEAEAFTITQRSGLAAVTSDVIFFKDQDEIEHIPGSSRPVNISNAFRIRIRVRNNQDVNNLVVGKWELHKTFDPFPEKPWEFRFTGRAESQSKIIVNYTSPHYLLIRQVEGGPAPATATVIYSLGGFSKQVTFNASGNSLIVKANKVEIVAVNGENSGPNRIRGILQRLAE